MRFDVDAVLFDIDGTLVDSTPAVARTWETWSARNGLDPQEVLSVCHGRRAQDTVAMFLPPAERAAAEKELLELELADMDGVVALPGVMKLLAALPPECWAAVTSGAGVLMRARLAAADLPAPQVLVAAEDVERGKPDPEGYQKAAAALDCEVNRCLVVEDAPAGVGAGHNAGAHVLAVTTSHSAEELCLADAVVKNLDDCTVRLVEGTLQVWPSGC